MRKSHHRPALVALVAAVATAFGANVAEARPGDLDSGFGSGGLAVFSEDNGDGSARSVNDMVVQPDGKIIVVGSRRGNFGVWRLNPDGTADSAFDGDGFRRIDFGQEDYARGVALVAGGKIVVVGVSRSYADGGRRLAIARLTADGILDRSFSGDGKVLRGDSDGSSSANEVAVDGQGRLLIVGEMAGYEEYGYRLGVYKYSPGGAPVASFGEQGVRPLHALVGGFTNTTTKHPYDITIGPNNSAFIVGPLRTAGDCAVVKVASSGRIVPTFGEDGVARAWFRGVGASCGGIEYLAANGTISIAGRSHPTRVEARIAVARFTSRGDLDLAFSDNGRRTLLVGDWSIGSDLALDGRKTVLVGVAVVGSDASWVLVRLTAAGDLDGSTFGSGGSVIGADPERSSAVSVVVSGGMATVAGSFGGSLAAGRFLLEP